jgi:aminomethyltransferase
VAVAEPELRRTPLFDEHRAAGARLVSFAGWEMPVSYEGVKQEHLAVRSGCGIFDVSHMGQIETRGKEAIAFLQRALSNDLERLQVGGAQYSCLCSTDGGILDDLFTYEPAEGRYLTVSNAANHGADLAHLGALASGFEVELRDAAADYAMIAVQGPEARAIVAGLASAELPARTHTAELEVAGAEALVCGTGYTGEPGVELLVGPAAAAGVWRALLGAGATPCGLGARDTLRLEVCFPLHGQDIGPGRNPIEAGLGWCCREATGFLGADAIATARAEGTAEKLVALTLTERGVPRPGNALLREGEQVGRLTSGTYAPSLRVGAGIGYVRTELAEPGIALEVDVRGRRRAAEIRPMPLYTSTN